jgi:hypothetical protein
MQAAGVEPDEETIERVEGGIADRLAALDDLFGRLDFHSSNPDYLRSRTETEASDGGS